MNTGLKNIMSYARKDAAYERMESRQPLSQGYDDDSGISGIGLTPVDDLDASYSSPETVSTTSSNSNASNSYRGGMQPMQFSTQYGHSYNTSTGGLSSGYSSSVSSTTAQGYGQVSSHSHHSQGGSPYMGQGQRLPSVDMGIDAIINRPGRNGGQPGM